MTAQQEYTSSARASQRTRGQEIFYFILNVSEKKMQGEREVTIFATTDKG
jgi:hypothetical protein